MSIFSKICPRCAGDNQVDATHCQCGFVFEASATTGSYRALEMAEQEAQVYAEYLQARVNQAQETVEIAIADQARFSDDDTKATVAKTANDEYLAAKVEYDEQMRLVVKIRKEAAKTQAEEQKIQESAWELAKSRAKEKAIQAEKDAVAAKLEEQKIIAEKIKRQQQAKRAAAEKEEKIRQKKLKASAARAAIAKLAGQKTPSPKMREKMADKAEAAAVRVRQAQTLIKKEMAAAAVALSATTLPASPSAAAPATGTQAKDAAAAANVTAIATKKKLAGNSNQKECPNCTAVVRVSAKECKCGYVFPQGTELMDSVGLSEEDSANLLDMFRPHH